jgi:hypothetical protein
LIVGKILAINHFEAPHETLALLTPPTTNTRNAISTSSATHHALPAATCIQIA